jgi:hypothetical protein
MYATFLGTQIVLGNLFVSKGAKNLAEVGGLPGSGGPNEHDEGLASLVAYGIAYLNISWDEACLGDQGT